MDQEDFEVIMEKKTLEGKKTAKLFTCEVCDRGFTRRDSWRRHHQTQHGDKEKKKKTEKYFCRVCAQHFTLRNNWLRHQRTHHQPQTNKRFTCPTCDRTFFRREHLIRHQQRHGNKRERVWDCEDCGKSFYRLWDWRTHQRGKHGSAGDELGGVICFLKVNFKTEDD
ncbi:oocyte zinc finger protein XlCOF26-like [Liolophura sinensis]|uniref:oocyte zinc finger protein XlCOF26-like n=1 Tax=Liolophura sinensis TaxID=3198878 RepID=UPI003158C366